MVGAGDLRPLAPAIRVATCCLNTFLSQRPEVRVHRRGRVWDATYLIGQDLRAVKADYAVDNKRWTITTHSRPQS